MLRQIIQTCRQIVRSAAQSVRVRQSTPLELCDLEQRATPAAVNFAAPVDAPVTVVVADLPAAPGFSDAAVKPIVRVDLMPAGTSAKFNADAWRDLLAGDQAEPENALFAHKAPVQETAAPTPDVNAEELAMMDAEWAVMQQG
jgi:hypothetical protein